MDKNIGNRLRKLRENANLTQGELYEEIQKKICEYHDLKYYEKEYENRSAVCGYEKGKPFEIDTAIGYSLFFDVSLDYLYFGTKSYKPEYNDIKKMLGLSNDALHNLEKIFKNNKQAIDALNKLLSPKLAPLFIELLEAFSEHSYIKTKSIVSQYPGNTFMSGFDIKGHIKNKPIILKPKDLEAISLFQISELSKKVADGIKNEGGRL